MQAHAPITDDYTIPLCGLSLLLPKIKINFNLGIFWYLIFADEGEEESDSSDK